ncbi:MAG: FtsX-like permease family protein, partial [Candidatus Methanofastidiosia archaeon]
MGAVGDITVWIDEGVLEKLKKIEGVDDLIVEFKWGRSVGFISLREKGITKTASAVFASDFEKEDKYFKLSECMIFGNLLNLDDSSIILSDWLAEGLKVGIGDTILVGGNTPYKELDVVGIFSAEKLEELRDLRGETLAPGSKNLNTGRWDYYPNQTVFLSFENAFEFTKKDSLYTDVVLMVQNQNLEKVVPEVLSIGDTGEVYPLRVIEINDGKVIEHVSYESLKIARVGPIIIVVMISALMILNTMLASMYERVGEIGILSSVGANPTNVGKLFLTESSILGLVGGLAGYILGILILFIGSSVSSGTVSQKFTLNWFVGSILLSLIVSISSAAYPASKASFLVVPSLRRSWKPSTMELIKGGEKYKVENEEQPIVIAPDEFEEFIHHIKEKMDRPIFYDLDNFYGHTEKEGDITKFIFGFLATPIGAPVKADVEIVGKFKKG